MNFLVVDDYAETPESLKILLGLYGHNCVTARNAKEALDRVAEEHEKDSCFDAIILDYLLPGGIDGLSLMKEIRKVCCNPGSPIILTSAVDVTIADELREQTVKEYRAGFIRKPFTLVELFDEMNRLTSETGDNHGDISSSDGNPHPGRS